MLEMRKLEEDDESRFEEEYNVWLSDEPLTNHEICKLMRGVERERKLEGKPPLVQFLPRSKRPKKTPNKTERVHSSRKLNGRRHPLRVWRAQCRGTRMPRKKPKAVMVDGVPIKPISAAEHKRLDSRIRKKHEKLRNDTRGSRQESGLDFAT